MPRNPEYTFVDTSTESLVSLLVQGFEQITGRSVQPASPEQQYARWIASILVHERVLMNYIGNQNIPSRAEGENLDALAQLLKLEERPKAQPAVCVQRFSISEAQTSAVLIPAGTRVTGSGGPVWETAEDVYVDIGDTYADTQLRCQTPGIIGNGYAPGQLDTLIDLYDYYTATKNLTTSDGGADEATDEEFYQLMRQSMDAYSCAGARGSYEYFAKKASTEIGDVIANSPTPGVVKLYVLMNDGTPAASEIKAAVLAQCSADEVRPLTDKVQVEDPEQVTYTISFTYYTQTGTSQSAAAIQEAVNNAVQKYIAWQSAKLGRDINPSMLIGFLMQTGIKRVALTSPTFTVLQDDGKTAPQVAKLSGNPTIVNGGYEDE